MHILEADGIQLDFGERKILSGIYLKAETGTITGLLGRNGSGKSSLMQAIYGTLPCEKSVRINQCSYPAAYSRPALLRYLPQFHFIPAALTLQKVFRDYALDFDSFEYWFPELAPAYKSPVGQLSGGGRRLVELYTLIKADTRFVLLDEPFTHISPVQVERIRELLLAEKTGKGFVITDHLYQQVLDISDRLYVLAHGRTKLVPDQAELEALGYIKA